MLEFLLSSTGDEALVHDDRFDRGEGGGNLRSRSRNSRVVPGKELFVGKSFSGKKEKNDSGKRLLAGICIWCLYCNTGRLEKPGNHDSTRGGIRGAEQA